MITRAQQQRNASSPQFDSSDFFVRRPEEYDGTLRGPAPKKRPMISGSKIESADFYLPIRGYRILFKNEFLLFEFRFKPKISSRKLLPPDSSKIGTKISPRKKRFRNHYRNAK